MQADYNDAVTLASTAQNLANDNVGLTNYFDNTVQDQLNHFRKMMAGVADGDVHYTIQFQCNDPKDVCANTGPQLSGMVIESTVGQATDVKIITVYPSFWTAVSSRYLLGSPQLTTPSPPYRTYEDNFNMWCGKDPVIQGQTERNSQFFATAGHAVLHEPTHLHSLSDFVDLQDDAANGNPAKGADDYQTGCELSGARQFPT